MKTEQRHIPIEKYYEAYKVFRRHCRDSRSQQVFEMNYAYNLAVIQRDVCQRTIDLGTCYCFVVDKPVPREIFAGSVYKRILDTLVVNILLPYMEPRLCYRHFNVRRGYGLAQFHDVLQADMMANKNGWTVAGDIKSFFVSMDKRVLRGLWTTVITEWYGGCYADELLYIVGEILEYNPVEHCVRVCPAEKWGKVPAHKSLFHADGNHGMPIGDLISQYSSILYTDDFCHRMSEKFPHFAMFADDWYVIGDYDDVLNALPLVRKLLAERGLQLNEQKVRIQPAKHGLKICGIVAYPNRRYISNRVVSNARQAIYSLWDCGGNLPPNTGSVLNSYFGVMRHCNTYNIRKELVKQLPPEFWERYYIKGHYEIIKEKRHESKENIQQGRF